VGAVWGAALLVFLPNWTNDLAGSFSLSTNVSNNLPIAVYGLVLIAAMLAWPSGIQGGVRAIAGAARSSLGGRAGRARDADAPEGADGRTALGEPGGGEDAASAGGEHEEASAPSERSV
jgi:branched-chain amino acid transport system permease protein